MYVYVMSNSNYEPVPAINYQIYERPFLFLLINFILNIFDKVIKENPIIVG